MNLPPPIVAFLQAKNNRDTPAVLACFTEDAFVHDEGRDMHGLAALREWSDQGFAKFHYTIEPTALRDDLDQSILTATVSGNFPGSPVSLDFAFTLRGDRIAALVVD